VHNIFVHQHNLVTVIVTSVIFKTRINYGSGVNN
jgi:hypothetical protein